MFKKTRFFLAVLTGMLCLVAARAEAQTSRLYFAGYLGLTKFSDEDFSENTTPLSGSIALDNTPSFAGALGLRLSKDIRIEAELNYANASLSSMTTSGTTFDLGGNVQTYIGLLNVFYDFDVPWKLQPFIGAGLGIGWFDGQISGAPAITASDEAMALAYQLGGGVKYRVSPDLAFTGAYRYVGAEGLSLGSYDLDYGSHEFRLGLEYDLPFK